MTRRGRSTVAELLASAFCASGVRRMFGVPGGGSSLDVIDAAARRDIEFVLTRTESAAVMMAAVTAELSGTPGVALTTKGPGTASAANGMAYASLDRAPVLLLTDGFAPAEQSFVTHQVFDQRAMLAPVSKGHSRLDGEGAGHEIHALIDLAMGAQPGPVHVELSGEAARAPAAAADSPPGLARPALDESQLSAAQRYLKNAVRPVLIAGLEAREAKAAAATRSLVESLRCPVLTTCKAKGVVADSHAQYVGVFTGGKAESECIGQADLIVLCGVDPVELIRQPWRYDAPVIDISVVRHPVHYVTAEIGLYGALDEYLSRLAAMQFATRWPAIEIERLRNGMRFLLQYPDADGMEPQQVVELAVEKSLGLPAMPRIAVDAGAHMFSAMAFWPCAAPFDVLISNGLATMAFALPAAIAAALHEADRPVIAFTGDGGLMMCLGELSTAAQLRARIVVVVFNDEALSLIDIKQQQRGFAPRGVRWSRPDFAATMVGLGGRGYRAETEAQYREALGEALRGEGPALIDVAVDPGGYAAQLQALRG